MSEIFRLRCLKPYVLSQLLVGKQAYDVEYDL